jgi:hypothetical protein
MALAVDASQAGRRHDAGTMKNPTALTFWLALAAATTLLVACGGGSNSTDGGHGTTPPPVTTTRITAVGGSASTVALGWAPVAAAGGYRIERQSLFGTWVTLAELPPESRDFVDEGLDPDNTYLYRVVARNGGQVLATVHGSTTEEVAPTSAPGELIGELARGVIGAAGGRLASAGGQVAVDVPAGAFAAATELVLRSTTNTAPDGRDDGVELSVAAAPAKPLQLTLGIGTELAAQAGGLRVALQRGDGSWLALPTAARSAQQLQVALPLAAAAAPGLATAAPSPYRLVRYSDLYLKPSEARVPVGGHKELIPYAHTLQPEMDCEGGDMEVRCVPTPVLVASEVPLRNDKAGYSRQWYVEGLPGGSAAVGMTATQVDFGAAYIAPQRAPAPNPVAVTFVSQNLKTGRTIALSAAIEVVEPRWTGLVKGYLGAADLAFAFASQSVWTLAPGGDLGSFTAAGTQSINVINITCTATASPASTALPPGSLTVDTSTTPATYTLDIGSLWDTVITGTCPGQPGQAVVPMKVPGRLQATGTVSGDGKKIEGRITVGGVDWDWALTSEL